RWREFILGIAPAARVEVVANPVVLDRNVQGADAGEEGRILFLGRADRRKGIYELIAAVARLVDAQPDIRLVIGGDGDLEGVRRAATEEYRISAHVEILGWIDPGR